MSQSWLSCDASSCVPCPFSRLMAVSPLLCFSEISSPTTFYWMSTVSARCSVVMHMYRSSRRQETSCSLGACHPLVSLSPAGSRIIPSFCAPLAVSCFLRSSVLYLQGTGHPVMLWCFWGCLGVLANTSFG